MDDPNAKLAKAKWVKPKWTARKTVYVVHTECPDYVIEGIYTTQGAAEERLAEIRDGGMSGFSSGISDYRLDISTEQDMGSLETPLYRAVVSIKTGELTVYPPDVAFSWTSDWSCINYHPTVAQAGSIHSQEQANKLAIEKRLEWLRENAAKSPSR